jgi:hypothetical protein
MFVATLSRLSPKLVAAAFGMNPEGVMIYLADRVDEPQVAEHLRRR